MISKYQLIPWKEYIDISKLFSISYLNDGYIIYKLNTMTFTNWIYEVIDCSKIEISEKCKIDIFCQQGDAANYSGMVMK